MPRGNPGLKLNNTPWPEERAQRLKRLFSNGLTDKQIASELGVTVRAVIGKRRRLRLIRWIKSNADDPLALALRRWTRDK